MGGGDTRHPGLRRDRLIVSDGLIRGRGGRTANAPVLKTGVRKDMRVRIPPPPFTHKFIKLDAAPVASGLRSVSPPCSPSIR